MLPWLSLSCVFFFISFAIICSLSTTASFDCKAPHLIDDAHLSPSPSSSPSPSPSPSSPSPSPSLSSELPLHCQSGQYGDYVPPECREIKSSSQKSSWVAMLDWLEANLPDLSSTESAKKFAADPLANYVPIAPTYDWAGLAELEQGQCGLHWAFLGSYPLDSIWFFWPEIMPLKDIQKVDVYRQGKKTKKSARLIEIQLVDRRVALHYGSTFTRYEEAKILDQLIKNYQKGGADQLPLHWEEEPYTRLLVTCAVIAVLCLLYIPMIYCGLYPFAEERFGRYRGYQSYSAPAPRSTSRPISAKRPTTTPSVYQRTTTTNSALKKKKIIED